VAGAIFIAAIAFSISIACLLFNAITGDRCKLSGEVFDISKDNRGP